MENENKNENVDNNVNQEVVSEENVNNEDVVVHEETKKENSKSRVYVIVGLLILIILGVILLLFISSRDNNDDGNDIIEKVTQSDDVPTFSDEEVDDKIDEELDDKVVVDDKVINIYQKGYSENGPIAFTYECESENCDLRVTDMVFILYDEEVVKYREMTTYEYEQINNSEVSPVGGRLDMDGFEEVKPFSEYKNEYVDFKNMFEIDSVIYILRDNKIFTNFEYNNIFNDRCDFAIKNKDILMLNCFVVNYKTNVEIDLTEGLAYSVLDYGYKNGFYYFLIDTSEDASPYYYVIVENTLEKYFFSGYRGIYIGSDKVYSINSDNNLFSIDKLGNKVFYEKNGNMSVYIYEDKLVYISDDGYFAIKFLLSDEIIYKSDIKAKYALILGNSINISGDYLEFYEADFSVLDDTEFNKFRLENDINDEKYNKIKKCALDDNEDDCNYYWFEIGYKIKLNKKDYSVIKEYYMNVD